MYACVTCCSSFYGRCTRNLGIVSQRSPGCTSAFLGSTQLIETEAKATGIRSRVGNAIACHDRLLCGTTISKRQALARNKLCACCDWQTKIDSSRKEIGSGLADLPGFYFISHLR